MRLPKILVLTHHVAAAAALRVPALFQPQGKVRPRPGPSRSREKKIRSRPGPGRPRKKNQVTALPVAGEGPAPGPNREIYQAEARPQLAPAK